MSRVEVEVQVAAPVERVFSLSTDVDGYAENVRGIDRVERLTEGPIGVGTRWRETRTMFGKSATEEMWITVFEPPRLVTVEASSHGAQYLSTFRFLPVEGGTRVSLEFSARPLTLAARVLSKLFGRAMFSSVAKALAADLEDLKRAAEATSA